MALPSSISGARELGRRTTLNSFLAGVGFPRWRASLPTPAYAHSAKRRAAGRLKRASEKKSPAAARPSDRPRVHIVFSRRDDRVEASGPPRRAKFPKSSTKASGTRCTRSNSQVARTIGRLGENHRKTGRREVQRVCLVWMPVHVDVRADDGFQHPKDFPSSRLPVQSPHGRDLGLCSRYVTSRRRTLPTSKLVHAVPVRSDRRKKGWSRGPIRWRSHLRRSPLCLHRRLRSISSRRRRRRSNARVEVHVDQIVIGGRLIEVQVAR